MTADIYIVSSITGLHRCNGIVGVVIEPEGSEARTVFGTVTDVTANQSVLLGIKFALSRINTEYERRLQCLRSLENLIQWRS